MASPDDLVIAGAPRAGTTLVCSLLNRCDAVVALSEPMDVVSISRRRTKRAMVRAIEAWYAKARSDLQREGTARARVVDGDLLTTNYALDTANPDTGRRDEADKRWQRIAVDKQLPEGFTLAVKHPALFTALLPQLAKRFPVLAVVRNPLALLSSWNTVDMAVAKGRLPIAEAVDARLRRRVQAASDVTARQVEILSWAFERIAELAPDRVVRYEDVVETGGRALAAAVPDAAGLDVELESRNRSEVYQQVRVEELAERLLATDGPHFDLYSRESVERLASDHQER